MKFVSYLFKSLLVVTAVFILTGCPGGGGGGGDDSSYYPTNS